MSKLKVKKSDNIEVYTISGETDNKNIPDWLLKNNKSKKKFFFINIRIRKSIRTYTRI